MEEIEEVVATFSQRVGDILSITPGIQYNGSAHPLYYVKDLQQSYRVVANCLVPLDVLVSAVQDKRSLLGVYICEFDRKHSIVYSPDAMPSEDVLTGIWELSRKPSMLLKSDAPCGKLDVCSGMSADNAGMAVKPSGCEHTGTTQDKPTISTKRLYDDSSDSCETKVPSTFKSPYLPSCPKIQPSTSLTLTSRIIASFCFCPVISVDSFSTAYCIANGVMLDYKRAPCPIPSHPHSSLSKFLRCYSDTLELLELKKLYIVLKTKEILDLNKRRLASYLVRRTDPMFKCHMEVLCVNLFSAKVCVALSDFLELFNHIYKNSLSALVAPAQPQEFLCNLASPNIILVKKSETYTITLTPVHSSEYCEWNGALGHKKVREAEELLIRGEQLDGSSLSYSTVKGRCVLPYSTESDNVKNLMAVADLNIPKLLQKRLVCDTGDLGYSVVWKYLKQSINSDGKRPYFTG